MKSGIEFAEAIRHMNCINLSDFQSIWGDHSGKHLWNKFAVVYKGNIAKFIMYLDCSNVNVLFKYLNNWLGRNE